MGEILEILAATFYDFFKKKKTFFFDYRPCKRDERRVCGGGGCRNHCSNGQGNVPANGNADWNTTKTDERFLLSAPHFVNIGPRARSYLSDTPGPFRLPILLPSEPSSREFCVLFFVSSCKFFLFSFFVISPSPTFWDDTHPWIVVWRRESDTVSMLLTQVASPYQIGLMGRKNVLYILWF